MSEPYPHDFSGGVGITFYLPSRRRFIPHSLLLYADMNEKGTELQIHYTHWLVTINGTNLSRLHDRVAKFQVSCVQEMPTMPDKFDPTITRIEITEKVSD
jgi:hypothetical protein